MTGRGSKRLGWASDARAVGSGCGGGIVVFGLFRSVFLGGGVPGRLKRMVLGRKLHKFQEVRSAAEVTGVVRQGIGTYSEHTKTVMVSRDYGAKGRPAKIRNS